jgi:hypothetical protein
LIWKVMLGSVIANNHEVMKMGLAKVSEFLVELKNNH